MKTNKLLVRQAPKPDGFALVATLSIIALIVILVMGLLGLAQTSLRRGLQDKARAQAQANARLSLSLALGELQNQMGPDQRISANGAITSNADVRHPNLTGVWDSWVAGPKAAAPVNGNYPSEESHHQTIGNQPAGSMRPDYANKQKYFRRWLLSLNPDEAIDPATPANLALDGAALPGKDDTAIRLVGQGSLGTQAPSGQFVSARLLKPSSASGNSRSRHAWWVGDENQKARVLADSY